MLFGTIAAISSWYGSIYLHILLGSFYKHRVSQEDRIYTTTLLLNERSSRCLSYYQNAHGLQ